MPLYLCNSAPDSIPAPARAAIAADITRIHCDATGAPPQFVHAFFLEDAASPPLGDLTAVVAGSIRGGRNDGQKQQIIDGIRASIAEHAGIDLSATAVITTDVPASWAMEGGEVMPEPGEEAEWLERHAAH